MSASPILRSNYQGIGVVEIWGKLTARAINNSDPLILTFDLSRSPVLALCYRPFDHSEASSRAFLQLALPYPDYVPTFFPQRAGDFAVSRLISLDLEPPRPSIRFWGDVLSASVSVPEATVHEYR